jgi:MFS family permease
VFGTFVGGAMMDISGRRNAIALSGAFFVVGPLAMSFASGVDALVFGRFVIGVGVGSSAVAVPAYLGEMAPASRRGMVVCLYELFLCFGLLISTVVSRLGMGDWHILFSQCNKQHMSQPHRQTTC